ncbi:transposase family protein [Streptomyces shenzhenensis]
MSTVAGDSDSLTPHDLRHPELTGMTREQLSDLTQTLIPRLDEHRERVRHAARGGPRRVARGSGRKPTLTPADQILVTILYLRKHSRQELLGRLFNTTAMTISRAVKGVRPLLEAHDFTVTASTARFRTPDDITAFLDSDACKIEPACSCRPARDQSN